jgi:hypothetical protein
MAVKSLVTISYVCLTILDVGVVSEIRRHKRKEKYLCCSFYKIFRNPVCDIAQNCFISLIKM